MIHSSYSQILIAISIAVTAELNKAVSEPLTIQYVKINVVPDSDKGHWIKRVPYVIKPEKDGLTCYFPGDIGPKNLTYDGNVTNEMELARTIDTRCRKENSMNVRFLKGERKMRDVGACQ